LQFGLELGLQPSVKNQPRSGHRSAEGWSVARRAKRLILLPLFLLLFLNCRFLPKNRMSSPKSNQILTNQQHLRGILVPLNPL
jgi:hypothetical protein